MKRKMFTGKEVLWGVTESNFNETQEMLNNLIPGAKAIILPDEILNYKPTDDELEMLGLKQKDELLNPLDFRESNIKVEIDFSELEIANTEGIVLNNVTLKNDRYIENNETKAA